MRQSIKAVLGLIIIIALVVTFFFWVDDRPDTRTWAFRIGGPIFALLILGVIFLINSRPDDAPDYLRALAPSYFNRDGFSFLIDVAAVGDVAMLKIYFQNQRDVPSVGRIAIRQGGKKSRKAPKFEQVLCEIRCEPAAFGVTRIPFPIPEIAQGKVQEFEVGASVTYPDGKGNRLRFHDGTFLRTNTNFGSALGTTLTVVGAFSGAIILSKPATTMLKLPTGVRSSLPAGLESTNETHWKLDDMPLDKDAFIRIATNAT